MIRLQPNTPRPKALRRDNMASKREIRFASASRPASIKSPCGKSSKIGVNKNRSPSAASSSTEEKRKTPGRKSARQLGFRRTTNGDGGRWRTNQFTTANHDGLRLVVVIHTVDVDQNGGLSALIHCRKSVRRRERERRRFGRSGSHNAERKRNVKNATTPTHSKRQAARTWWAGAPGQPAGPTPSPPCGPAA